MAKLDKGGNRITAPPLLRNLYLETYVERLRHREMKPDFMDVYEIKSTLWKYRMEMLKENKSDDWVTEDIVTVLKKLTLMDI